MSPQLQEKYDLGFGKTKRYRILVRGSIAQHWIERMAAMEVVEVTNDDGIPRTELIGSVKDQTELSGVLETIHGLHLPIVRVEELDD